MSFPLCHTISSFEMHLSNLTGLIFLIFLGFGCVEVIDFQTEESEQLKIYGRLTNSNSHNPSISIEYSSVNLTTRTPIEHAEVFIVDKNGTEHSFQYVADKSHYEPIYPFKGQPGQSYQLQVTINDESYISNWETMPHYLSEDYSNYEIENVSRLSSEGVEVNQNVVSIFLENQFPNSSENYYLRWDIEEVYLFTGIYLPNSLFPFYSPLQCFISRLFLPEQLLLYSSEENSLQEIPKRKVGEVLIDETFEEVHYFGIIQNSINRECYQYWKKVDEIVNRSGSIFELPPATIPGNIREKSTHRPILGYFEVARVDTSQFLIHRGDIPFHVPSVCGNRSNWEYGEVTFRCYECLSALGIESECLNCLELPNSTVTKPSFIARLQK
jgi:hypothetical protein